MTIPPAWPDKLNNIWAKSASRSESSEPETLALHTWYVLERLADTIRLRPTLPQQIGFSRLWHCLFWACFLHDFGKAAKGFQELLRDGKHWSHRHEVLSLAFINWLGFSEEENCWIAAAIVSHHREAEEIQFAYSARGDPDNKLLAKTLDEIDEKTLNCLWSWLVECPQAWLDELSLKKMDIDLPILPPQGEAVSAIKDTGAINIRTWLNTYQRWIKTIRRSDERALIIGTIALRGHIISSDHLASAHTGELPESKLSDPEQLLERWNINSPYAHQHDAMDINGSAVLMAPTGSGKTEASLLWAVAQAEEGRSVPRLYYMLPYQASMNAMYDRLNDDTKRTFPGQVGLEHSRSTLAYYRRLLLDESDSSKKAMHSARWLNNLARLNYYPVRVLSPYQILKGPYRLKGYESLLADCFESAFILDEVHAYEAKRLALILGTVKYLREEYGAKFFMMSATLPAILRDRLAEALGNYSMLQASPDLYKKFQRHKLMLRDGNLLDSTALNQIAEVSRAGQSVLVCCNTVKRAQQAYRELGNRLGTDYEIVLLHGRFNGKDRLAKEEKVREATGSKSTRRRPIVLVATQVVEVSLDIDLDTIYTDPAPLEALLQRFGRVNRRRLKAFAPVHVFREPADGQRIYNRALVEEALGILEKNDRQMIDEARVSDWLDEVYKGEIAEEWNAEYQFAYDEFWDGVLMNLRAFDSDKGLEEEFYKAFDGVEVLPLGHLDEYQRSLRVNPLEASQLLVSIRWGQLMQLNKNGQVRVETDSNMNVVDAYYDSEFGLDLRRRHSYTNVKC